MRQAQLALAEDGFEPGEIDGVYGPQTARAVRGFQGESGLTADGIVGPATWAALVASEPTDLDRSAGEPEVILLASMSELEQLLPLAPVLDSYRIPWRATSFEPREDDFGEWIRERTGVLVIACLSPTLVAAMHPPNRGRGLPGGEEKSELVLRSVPDGSPPADKAAEATRGDGGLGQASPVA